MWDPIHQVMPITLLELKAVTHNLRAFFQQLHRHQGKVGKVWEDHQAVFSVLNSMTSKSPVLMKEFRTLHKVLVRLGNSIDSQYEPFAVNRFADRLSRPQSLDDWRINQEAIAPLLKTLPPTVDRFADYKNTLCHRFNSLNASPHSPGIEDLSQAWHQETNFCNPPIKILPMVVAKIFKEKALGILATQW